MTKTVRNMKTLCLAREWPLIISASVAPYRGDTVWPSAWRERERGGGGEKHSVMRVLNIYSYNKSMENTYSYMSTAMVI